METNDIEILTVELNQWMVTSFYKRPDVSFGFSPPDNSINHETQFLIGDAKSHNSVWWYDIDDKNGEAVLSWQEVTDYVLVVKYCHFSTAAVGENI